MQRAISAAYRAAIAEGNIRPALFAEIETEGGFVRAWSGIGDYVFNGDTYTGVGNLGGVSPIKETSDLQATGCNFELSGIPSSIISVVLGQIRYGRSAKLWLGLFDNDSPDNLIADPYLIFSGLTDNAAIDEGPETSRVTVSAESRYIDLQRTRSRRYTHEDQQLRSPGDLGFQYVPSIQDKEIVFGS